ncbi:hypothetical protein FRC11_007741, partial [Ceratobasidium sp. 423]
MAHPCSLRPPGPAPAQPSVPALQTSPAAHAPQTPIPAAQTPLVTPQASSAPQGPQKLPINTENTYSQNYFRGGRFCRCAQTYDVKRERETM